MRCEPGNKDIFAPVADLRDDFLAFSSEHGVPVSWAAHRDRGYRSRMFRRLLMHVKPGADLPTAYLSRSYLGKTGTARVCYGMEVQAIGIEAEEEASGIETEEEVGGKRSVSSRLRIDHAWPEQQRRTNSDSVQMTEKSVIIDTCNAAEAGRRRNVKERNREEEEEECRDDRQEEEQAEEEQILIESFAEAEEHEEMELERQTAEEVQVKTERAADHEGVDTQGDEKEEGESSEVQTEGESKDAEGEQPPSERRVMGKGKSALIASDGPTPSRTQADHREEEESQQIISN